MPATQNFKNHTRFDPPFHFFLVPVLLANVILSIYITVRDWPKHSRSHLWWIVISIALFLLLGTMRRYAAANQDRIIRLEERLRYAALLTPVQLTQSQNLTRPQVIALRFASDAELPGLMERALAENLGPKQIKQSIVSWRADNHRI